MHSDVQKLIETVSAWADIHTQPHRFGGVEFKLQKVEIGHVHGHGLVDIPLTRKLRDLLVDDGQAQPHHLLAESGWVSFYLRKSEDVAQAVRLMRLSYVQKRARRRQDLDVAAELRALAFSSKINAVVAKPGSEGDA